MERAIAVFIFLTLPIERVLTLEVAGYTLRPVYLGMGLFLLLHARYLLRATREVIAVGAIVLATVMLSVPRAPHEASLTSALYGLWAAFSVAFFLAMVGYLREEGNLHLWVRDYVWSAAVWGGIALAQWVAALRWPGLAYSFFGAWPRVHALTLEPSYLAIYLLPPLFLAIGGRSVLAWPIALALALSTARTGALGFVAGLMALAFLPGGRSLVKDQALLVAVTLCLMAFTSFSTLLGAFSVSIPALPDPVEQTGKLSSALGGETPGAPRLEDTPGAPRLEVRDTTSVAPRLASWKEAWEVWRRHPWGVGVGAYGYAVSRLEDPRSHKTTNLFLEVLAENGPMGLLALLLWALWPVGRLWRKRQDRLSLALLGALVAGVVTFPFFQTWWRPYLWCAWGIAYASMDTGDR